MNFTDKELKPQEINQVLSGADIGSASKSVRGERIRTSRSLEDKTSVGTLVLKLEQLHREGVIARKVPDRMSLTVFDTANYSKPLPHNHSEETVEELLKLRMPTLFKPFPADIEGMGIFGHYKHPCIALTFATDFLDIESMEAVGALFPGVTLNKVASHLTVARAFSRERAVSALNALEDFLPPQVIFNGASVAVGEKRT
jgi:hypothetical protein